MEYRFYNREVKLIKLLEAFKVKVINQKSILVRVIHEKSKIGKIRLNAELVMKLGYGIELHSDIPKL
jgi:hypothetical protein